MQIMSGLLLVNFIRTKGYQRVGKIVGGESLPVVLQGGIINFENVDSREGKYSADVLVEFGSD